MKFKFPKFLQILILTNVMLFTHDYIQVSETYNNNAGDLTMWKQSNIVNESTGGIYIHVPNT